MQEPNNDGAEEFDPRALNHHLETFLPRIRAFADVLLSGSEEYAPGTLNELGVAMREAIDETETVAIECETARIKARGRTHEPAMEAADATSNDTALPATSDDTSDQTYDANYMCPRWWGVQPGEPITDDRYTDAIGTMIERIDGIGWLLMNMQSCDADEASSVAGILVDTATEAKALKELWRSTLARKSEDATNDAGAVKGEAA